VVLDEQRVMRVDPSSGARTLLSDATPNNEPPLAPLPGFPGGSSLQGIAVEATGEFAVVDAIFDAVLRVDARSGDRAMISR
jgi:hypothetical protein